MDKVKLREYIKKQRDLMDEKDVESNSKVIMEKLTGLKSFQNAETIMCFASFGTEVDTFPILSRILAEGRNLVLPRVEKSNNQKVLGLYKVDNLEGQLVKGVFGIMEPDPEVCTRTVLSEIDLCICPGVVFDKKCNRIGYGGGFYDRLLKDAECLKIAIAFDLQVVDLISPEPYDVPMDKVITEKSIY